MNIQRRKLIKYSASGMLLSCASLSWANSGKALNLSLAKVEDGYALPAFADGDYLLVDTGITRFGGEGVYLYPAWGKPRAYLVRRVSGSQNDETATLEFCNPGSKRVLWTQSLSLEEGFAAQVCGQVADLAALEAHRLSPLSVPHLPQPLA